MTTGHKEKRDPIAAAMEACSFSLKSDHPLGLSTGCMFNHLRIMLNTDSDGMFKILH